MSYPYQGGGYPAQQPYGGYPAQQPGPGYPAQGGGMPQPDAGLPYPAQPAGIGFDNLSQGAPVSMPTPGSAGAYSQSPYPAAGGGYGAPQPGYPAGPPQPGYGAPPAQPGYPAGPPQPGYPAGPPQPGYPAGPPQPGYPAGPPQPGYGAPPAQPGYGAPPAQPGYGAPPAQPGYHTPSPPQGGAGYGAPTHGAGAGSAPPPASNLYPGLSGQNNPPTTQMQHMSIHGGSSPASQKRVIQGTVKPASPFDAEEDAKRLRKAMKGFGTDEKAIIDVLCYRTNDQRQEILKLFKTMYGKDLIKELKSELGGRFEDVIIGLMSPLRDFDAKQLHDAISGIGTDEDALIEIMCSRSNAEIQQIKDAYRRLFKKDLEKHLASDTSGHFKRLMVAMSMGNRQESMAVDAGKAQRDAQALYQAGEKRWGTDESQFNAILASQSHEQLRLVFAEYHKLSKRSMEQAIRSEFSGDIERGLLTIVKVANNPPAYYAEKLYKSMKGAGTNDKALIRVMVTRCEVDMVQIKLEFQKMYSKTLESFIEGDCSGDYKKTFLALARG